MNAKGTTSDLPVSGRKNFTGDPARNSAAPSHGIVPEPASEPTRDVVATVVALVPEYHQVKVRAADGRLYALTRMTSGVDLATLREGQRFSCTVTERLPRVLHADRLA